MKGCLDGHGGGGESGSVSSSTEMAAVLLLSPPVLLLRHPLRWGYTSVEVVWRRLATSTEATVVASVEFVLIKLNG